MRSNRTDNRIKRHSLRARIASLLAVVVILFSLAAPVISVHAAGENASLTITFSEKQTGLPGAAIPIPGVRVKIYQVASVDVETWHYTMTPDFAGSGVTVEQMMGSAEDAQIAATTLHAYTLTDPVAATGDLTSGYDGEVIFTIPANKQGIILVVPESTIINGVRYDFRPYLVQVPGMDVETGDPIYYAESNIKNSSSTNLQPQTLNAQVIFSGDNGVGRPSSVTVDLYRNGTHYTSQTLSAANNWFHQWTNLRASDNWTVVGRTISGYNLTTTADGITTKLTYTFVAPPAPNNSSYSTASTNTLPGDTIPGATVPMMAGIGTLVAAVGAAKFLL